MCLSWPASSLLRVVYACHKASDRPPVPALGHRLRERPHGRPAIGDPPLNGGVSNAELRGPGADAHRFVVYGDKTQLRPGLPRVRSLTQGTGLVPPAGQSTEHKLLAPAFARRGVGGDAAVREANVLPCVSRLLMSGRPPTVSWLVVAVVVDAIDRVPRARSAAHVREENLEVSPSFTDRDAAPTVRRPVPAPLVEAPIAHVLPCRILGRPVWPGFAVLARSGSPAPAAAARALPKLRSVLHEPSPAKAFAVPLRPARHWNSVDHQYHPKARAHFGAGHVNPSAHAHTMNAPSEVSSARAALCRGAGLVCDPYATARPTWRITR